MARINCQQSYLLYSSRNCENSYMNSLVKTTGTITCYDPVRPYSSYVSDLLNITRLSDSLTSYANEFISTTIICHDPVRLTGQLRE